MSLLEEIKDSRDELNILQVGVSSAHIPSFSCFTRRFSSLDLSLEENPYRDTVSTLESFL